MRAWLPPLAAALARGEAAVLVHVAVLEGSGPREAGAQMLVTESALAGTIGGGELERMAVLTARDWLLTGRAGLVRTALGPELNQCCGGAVTLAFEPFAPADRAWVGKLMAAAEEPAPLFRTVRIDAAGRLQRDWSAGGEGPDYDASLTSLAVRAFPLPARERPSRAKREPGEGVRGSTLRSPTLTRSAHAESTSPILGEERGAGEPTPGPSPQGGGERSVARLDGVALTIRERVNPEAQPLWLFGAGHVGRAVAQALAPLGFALTWIDGRAGQFPDPAPAGIRTLALAVPELIVDEAPPGTMFLVMTHSHPLDEAICEAVLRRADFAYLGLIGSGTKRARFRNRLAAAGIGPAALERLVCPIGLPGIESKAPAAIAASVAADLLIRRERIASRQGEGALDER